MKKIFNIFKEIIFKLFNLFVVIAILLLGTGFLIIHKNTIKNNEINHYNNKLVLKKPIYRSELEIAKELTKIKPFTKLPMKYIRDSRSITFYTPHEKLIYKNLVFLNYDVSKTQKVKYIQKIPVSLNGDIYKLFDIGSLFRQKLKKGDDSLYDLFYFHLKKEYKTTFPATIKTYTNRLELNNISLVYNSNTTSLHFEDTITKTILRIS